MINEGIYRSPKWLRNFLDYEINTGKDIKGEPSEKAKRKEKEVQERAKKRAELKKWDDAWKKLYNTEVFREFLNTLIGNPIYFYISNYQMEVFLKQFRGNYSIFEDFSKYNNKKSEENKKIAELDRTIRALIKRITSDSKSAPYIDKISSYRNTKGEFCIKYKFENNDLIDIFNIKENKFKFSDGEYIHTYTVNMELWNLLIQAINGAQSRSTARPSSSRSGSSNRNGSSSKANSTNPKYDRYKTLLDTIDLRKKQLSKMSISDPERDALKNELDAAQRMAAKMKAEYKFENIKSFNDFDSIKS
jgi:hypothetical protein